MGKAIATGACITAACTGPQVRPEPLAEPCGPELSTALLFYGAELLSNGVTVDGRERFTLVEVSNTMLRLVPSERVMPGERFRLTVRFKDGEAPASAAFWLVVSPDRWSPSWRCTASSTSTVAGVLWLTATQGMQPLRVVRVELVGAGRRALRVCPPWQAEPLSPGATDPRVVIEADATEAEIRGRFTFKLWDADGTRSVIVTGVTFP